ncbi:MAG: ABC transporter permease [Bacteroidetes bacterium]|nr:ABC transporter permease [Bacteroidota bacterium]
MLKHFLMIGNRLMLRRKVFSFINTLGLATGLASCLIILLWVADELSYDKFHEGYDRIYRVTVNGKFNGLNFRTVYTPAPLPGALLNDFPEIEYATRLMIRPQHSLRRQEVQQSLIEDYFAYADSSFFDVFSYKLLAGDPKKALTRPKSIVLTQSAARRWFGDEDPMGKVLIENEMHRYTVTGIMADPPPNSHMRFNMVVSMTSIPYHAQQSWLMQGSLTYFKLREGAGIQHISDSLDAFLMRHIKDEIVLSLGLDLEQFAATGQVYRYELQPLADIHLHSNLDGELRRNGNLARVWLFSAIALIILLLACINFMNLSTAKAAARSREVGIRKVMGSYRTELVWQFLFETFLYLLLALALALLMVELALPWFNNIAAKELRVTMLFGGYFPLVMVAMVALCTLAAGIYPSLYLSAFEPAQVLKGQLLPRSGMGGLRRLLVVFQFSSAILLMISSFVVYRQLEFVHSKDLGFQLHDVLVIKRVHGLGERIDEFREKVKQVEGVVEAGYALNLPGDEHSTNSVGIEGRPVDQVRLMAVMMADYHLADALKLRLMEGRWFSPDEPSDTAAIVINRAALEQLQITDWTKERIELHGALNTKSQSFRIVGVVDDFHYESLRKKVNPIAILLRRGYWMNRMAINVERGHMPDVLDRVRSLWDEMDSGQPFEFTTMDTQIGSMYSGEETVGKVYTIFSMLALLIAALGLFGLSTHTIESRTRELGIRKILGASNGYIVRMLLVEFTRWVLIAALIAWPLAWWMMNRWLQGFAYHVDLSVAEFMLATLLTWVVAFFSVVVQAFRASQLNPVEALKYQ